MCASCSTVPLRTGFQELISAVGGSSSRRSFYKNYFLRSRTGRALSLRRWSEQARRCPICPVVQEILELQWSIRIIESIPSLMPLEFTEPYGRPSAAAGTKPDADRQPTHQEAETASARSPTLTVAPDPTSHVTKGLLLQINYLRPEPCKGRETDLCTIASLIRCSLWSKLPKLTYRAISRPKHCLFVAWVLGVSFENTRCNLSSI